MIYDMIPTIPCNRFPTNFLYLKDIGPIPFSLHYFFSWIEEKNPSTFALQIKHMQPQIVGPCLKITACNAYLQRP